MGGRRGPSRADPDRWDWEEVRARCARVARTLMGEHPEADDVAQEAALRAWRQRSTCRTPDEPGPWLRQIARNEAMRRFARTADPSAETADQEAEDPDAWTAERSLTRISVQTALDRLTAQDAQLLRLRYEEDLTQPAIAAHLGLPEGTVKVRLHRLRNRLRDDLAA